MGDVARIYFIQEDANLACMRAQLGLLTLVADSQPPKRSDIDQLSNDITCLSSWKQGHSAKAQNGTSTGRKRTKEKDTKSTKRRKYKRTGVQAELLPRGCYFDPLDLRLRTAVGHWDPDNAIFRCAMVCTSCRARACNRRMPRLPPLRLL